MRRVLRITQDHRDPDLRMGTCGWPSNKTLIRIDITLLGGARPKANFTETDGSPWIGRFPARDDDRDVGAREHVAHTLARKAGVDVPAARLIRLDNDFHAFCIQRFDRARGTRRFYASAMTLLRKEYSEGTSYLELA
jgi:serine/threonine-protein kinase HipA